jgi:FkbM family methyltransferase
MEKYGVLVDGEFEERETFNMEAKGFSQPMIGRVGTYDHYVMKEINRSYGQLDVEGRVVLDIGANIGCFTCWALQRKPLHVIALEPEINNWKMLTLNVSPYEADGFNAATVYNAALRSGPSGEGEMYLSKTGKNPGNSSTTPRRGRVAVPISFMGVDTLKSKHPVIDVAKIDCEGAEYEFIQSLIGAYPDLRQVALEIHINGFGLKEAKELHTFMLSEGFTAKIPPRLDNDSLWQTLATYER